MAWDGFGKKTVAIRLVAVACAVAFALAGCSVPHTGSAGSSTASGTQVGSSQASASGSAAQADYSQARVSYLGPEGTYTQEACGAFFGGQGSYLPKDDVAASVQALVDAEVDYAVIPQENTIGGPIPEYLDEVVYREGVSIVGEVELPINQNLLVKPGTELADVKTVYSHKQGIAQGSEWLSKNLPQAKVVEVSSTAEGAKQAAADKTGESAAIASAAAAEVYGLEVGAPAIQMNDANKTRFYVLSTAAPADGPDERMAFTASGKAEDLAKLLASVEAAGLSAVAVHDRPEKTELGSYTYLIECAGGGQEDFAAIQEECEGFTLRYLGGFPVRNPA